MTDPVRVLLLENDGDDAELVKDVLDQGGLDVRIERVDTEQDLRNALLQGSWNVILLDYVLPGFSGAKALKICHEMRPRAPVIIVSGSIGEDVAVELMKQGADDYVLKNNLTRLPAAVRRALASAHTRAQRHRAQKELRESREWLQATLRSIGEAVIATDAAGHVRFMNRVAEDLILCKEADAIARDIDEILQFAGDGGQRLPQSPSKEVIANAAGQEQRELVLLRKDGVRLDVICSATRILNDQEAIVGSVIALRDITERKRAEEQIRQANQELQQFFHSVSHDLQEPLRMISLYSEMIQRKLQALDQDTQEYLRFVASGAARMTDLLRDLRAYADVTRPRSPETQEADGEVALQKVLLNLSAAIEESSAIVAHEPLPKLPIDSAHLVQLFQNLISNSIKYRKRDHPPTIRIETARDGNNWQFSFSDNGVGIAPQYKERVFDFFKRFHNLEIPGTGMGLAICQRIVQRYGGRIWLDSSDGNGSTFYFTLPALPIEVEKTMPGAPDAKLSPLRDPSYRLRTSETEVASKRLPDLS